MNRYTKMVVASLGLAVAAASGMAVSGPGGKGKGSDADGNSAATSTAAPALAANIVALDVNTVDIPAAATKTSVFIVQMRDNPAVAYEGDISGYKSTKPGKNKKINPNSSRVKKYVRHLESSHDAALAAIGVSEKIYSYRYALNGFAAVMTSAQAASLSSRDDVVQVWRDEIRQPTTNNTPDYLGLRGEGGVWEQEGKGEDMIIGIIDTGISPEHPSFSDQIDFSHATGKSGKRNLAYGPPPANWYGSCQSGENFSQNDCNNKLIGARYYADGFSAHGNSGLSISESQSPRDTDGHGSHTAGTAAGNEGPLNTINGEPVSGIAPRARIAAYKVCWEPRGGGVDDGGCAGSDSAAAIDQAVADGVDVINFSIGGGSTVFAGPDDIAFLWAADAGVFVATSNGNAGPEAQTTGTPAGVPWITAVGASQDDNVFALSLEVSAPEDVVGGYFALEGGGDVLFDAVGNVQGGLVSAEPLDACTPLTNSIDGEIALVIRGACAFTDKYNNAAAAGASAIIVYNDGADASRINPIVMSAPGTNIPGAMIGFVDGFAIQQSAGPAGLIGPDTKVSQDNRIADFSSRGPNGGAPDVIKPDVAAPGVSIIAAETMTPNTIADGGVPYQSISGTSMASPHVAGIFALLKEANPGWSPAMAKSAIMTSARQGLKKTLGDDAADPFDIGAGHVVPMGAFAPGLVYNAGLFDYAAFTCGNNIQLPSDEDCALLAQFGFSFDGSDLNLASIGIADFIGAQTVTRTVTSVSPDGTEFTADVDAPSGVDVLVEPSSFVLNEGESQDIMITFTANDDAVGGEWTFGGLTWNNNAAQTPARSPIAIRPLLLSADAEVDAVGTAGSADVEVAFGYTGVYTAPLSGLAEASAIPGNVSAAEGEELDILCADLPAQDHMRFATFDEDTTTPGADDIDLRIFAVDNCTDFNVLAQIGGSGGATSNEVIDLANTPAGGYAFVIDYYEAASGSDIDYTAFIYLVLGSDGETTLDGVPASATKGTVVTETVNYSGLNKGSRYLGVISHRDDGGEIGRTIVDVNAQ